MPDPCVSPGHEAAPRALRAGEGHRADHRSSPDGDDALAGPHASGRASPRKIVRAPYSGRRSIRSEPRTTASRRRRSSGCCGSASGFSCSLPVRSSSRLPAGFPTLAGASTGSARPSGRSSWPVARRLVTIPGAGARRSSVSAASSNVGARPTSRTRRAGWLGRRAHPSARQCRGWLAGPSRP